MRGPTEPPFIRWNLPLARTRMAVVYVPEDWTPEDVADLVRYLRLFRSTRLPEDERRAVWAELKAEAEAVAVEVFAADPPADAPPPPEPAP